MKFKLLTVVLATLAGSAMAEDKPYAQVEALDGLVTVSGNNKMVSAVKGMPLEENMVVVNSSTATSTVTFRDGCTVRLKNSQALKVKASECVALLAAGGGSGAAGSGGTVFGGASPVVVGGAILGGALIIKNLSDDDGATKPISGS